jgi:hypothetical protein
MNNLLPDFDVLVALHRNDPDALEDFRRHMLREAVDYAPLEHRAALEQLIAQMEAARETASDPMEATLIAFRMMQESVTRLHSGWQQAMDAAAALQAKMLIEQARASATNRA